MGIDQKPIILQADAGMTRRSVAAWDCAAAPSGLNARWATIHILSCVNLLAISCKKNVICLPFPHRSVCADATWMERGGDGTFCQQLIAYKFPQVGSLWSGYSECILSSIVYFNDNVTISNGNKIRFEIHGPLMFMMAFKCGLQMATLCHFALKFSW